MTSEPSSTTRRTRILAVEDHFLARLAIATLIGDQSDMEIVGTAETGKEAIDLYRRHAPDLVLMDLRLPEMDGIAATAAICEAFSNARILILSHYESEEDVTRALEAGARGYVKKDASSTTLLDAVRTVRDGRRYFPTAIAERTADRLPRANLTPRELEVLTLIFKGRSNREIGETLGIGEGTVRIHVSNLLLKLGVKRRTEAVAVGLKRGLLRAE